MADLAWTANTLLVTSGPVVIRTSTETIAEGDWLYEVAAGETVGVASNADAAKDTVIGQAINGGVTGKDITVALDGAVVSATATPAIATCSWYVLSAAGATSPVADQTTSDYASLVARGVASGSYQIEIVNSGLQAP